MSQNQTITRAHIQPIPHSQRQCAYAWALYSDEVHVDGGVEWKHGDAVNKLDAALKEGHGWEFGVPRDLWEWSDALDCWVALFD